MGNRWYWMAILFGLLAPGCSSETKPVQRPASENVVKLPRGLTGNIKASRYNLPLVIHIDFPEVPPEIERPSPPIKK